MLEAMVAHLDKRFERKQGGEAREGSTADKMREWRLDAEFAREEKKRQAQEQEKSDLRQYGKRLTKDERKVGFKRLLRLCLQNVQIAEEARRQLDLSRAEDLASYIEGLRVNLNVHGEAHRSEHELEHGKADVDMAN
jgi:hypothetical protein